MMQSSANGGTFAAASFQSRFSFLVEPGQTSNGLSSSRSSLSATVSSPKKKIFDQNIPHSFFQLSS